jgi:mannose-6-phosphate isomerase-like protein (cupin superfamily)
MKQGIIVRQTRFARISILALTILALASVASAQYNGGPGDAVVYTVTYNGSANYQYPGLSATNTQANLAGFKKTVLSTVPVVGSDPFPLQRQVLFMNNQETFQIGTDTETTVGLHRLFVFPTKLIVINGVNLPTPGGLGEKNDFISFPLGLDVCCDVALETLTVATWFPGPWPFIVLTDHRGNLGPPDIPGFQYLFQIPNAVKLPALLPWTNMNTLYPNVGWQPGTDLRLLEADTTVGSTIREMRMRPGAKTPMLSTPGHNHMFILSGSVTITPAGGTPLVLNQNDYVYLPEGFSYTLSNPVAYSGPVSK